MVVSLRSELFGVFGELTSTPTAAEIDFAIAVVGRFTFGCRFGSDNALDPFQVDVASAT